MLLLAYCGISVGGSLFFARKTSGNVKKGLD